MTRKYFIMSKLKWYVIFWWCIPLEYYTPYFDLFLQFVCVESLVTAVVDMYPKVFRRGYRRELLILALSIVSYLIGLIMLTEVRLLFIVVIIEDYYCHFDFD